MKLQHYWRKYDVIAYIVLVAIIIGSFQPVNTMSVMMGSDKFYHAGAYMLLTFAFLWSRRKLNMKYWLFLIGLLILLGGLIEVLQPLLSPGRHRDMYDLVANTTGIFLAVLCLLIGQRWRARTSLKQ